MDVKIEKKKGILGFKPKYIVYGLSIILFIVLLIIVLRGEGSTALKVSKIGLNIVDVASGNFDDYVRVDGRVLPIRTVQISPEEGGIVREIVVEEGSKVRKGDVIVRLSNSNLDLQILNSEAELAEKQNILRNTQISMEQDLLNNKTEQAQLDLEVTRKKRAYEQKKRLYEEKLGSREDYIQSKEDYDLAVKRQLLINRRLERDSVYRLAQVDQMEENLANMQRNVVLIRERKDHLDIISAIDGELGLLDVELGQNITSGQKIGQINDLSDYKVEALVDEHYIDRVHEGLDATFERGGQNYNMCVRKVYPEVRESKFRVEFVFTDQHPENIRSGQTYNLNVQLGQPTEAVIIPRGTFYSSTGGKWIFVVNKEGTRAYRRNIRLGRHNPQHYEVLEGLEPGEKVVVNGYEAYGDSKVLNITN